MIINGLKNIDEMDGHEFEYFCADVLRRNGFSNIEVTKGSGDNGTDILARKDEKAYAIQCKRFSGNVGKKAVQEALSGKVYYSCDIAVVLTNSFFTEQAVETARRTEVLLWNRNKLLEMMKTAYPDNAVFSPQVQDYQTANSWIEIEKKSSTPTPTFSQTYSQERNNKIIRQPSKPRRKIGCLGTILISFAIISIIGAFGRQAETEERETKKDIMVSAINRDEDPTATINITPMNPEGSPVSVIVNGVCYVINGDHFEVVGLSDFKLTSIKIQEAIDGIPVTTIQEKAFKDESIISVYLPSSITDIQRGAFSTCRKLTKINLPDGLTKISESTFILCESLQSIKLPSSVTEIESSAFSSTALNSINLENVTIIGNGAFSYTKLKSVSLSPSLTKIGDKAFEGCHSLTNVIVPEGVESIGKECFASCEKLKSISLPETLTTIGNRCFNGCRALTEIRIPSNVKSLHDRQMFGFCLALEVIYIPADCEIPSGSEPFYDCNNPRIVYY